MAMDSWLEHNLVCPRDMSNLQVNGDQLVCDHGHSFPYVDGLPVMLLAEEAPTHPHCHLTLSAASRESRSDARGAGHGSESISAVNGVDPYVQEGIAGTCGYYFVPAINRLTEYPIPELRLPAGEGRRLLDIGCNWGRWCISAARLGYRPVGIDPVIDAVRAARRVARQLGIAADYLVADGRHLPFRPDAFDVAHSYSVLMHFSKEDATNTVKEIARVLRPDGTSLVQMANTFGLRNLQIQLMRGINTAFDRGSFAVRYWTPRELIRSFNEIVGPSHLEIEGFFSTSSGSQSIDCLPAKYKFVLATSDLLRRIGSTLPPLKYVADSLYVRSTRMIVKV
jgi:2-polyprenyl-3-methyl-5-hydroxy-6-metoxy-1,4-benzoquinol methylase/uncharacterized protein YbaR (Trm112 family)